MAMPKTKRNPDSISTSYSGSLAKNQRNQNIQWASRDLNDTTGHSLIRGLGGSKHFRFLSSSESLDSQNRTKNRFCRTHFQTFWNLPFLCS